MIATMPMVNIGVVAIIIYEVVGIWLVISENCPPNYNQPINQNNKSTHLNHLISAFNIIIVTIHSL